MPQARDTLTCRLPKLLEGNAKPDWCWFEDEVSCDNAKLAEALILTGHATGQSVVLERGLEALRWLNELHISEKGHFRPIGSNGFYRRGGVRAKFDQQPMVSDCLEAFSATSDLWWYEQAQRAFDWFIGWNDLGLEFYSPESGACGDGLHVDRVNGNQGAESTLAFPDLHAGVCRPSTTVQLRRRADEAAHRITGSEQLWRESPTDVAGYNDSLRFGTSWVQRALPYLRRSPDRAGLIRAAGTESDSVTEETIHPISETDRPTPI